mmetsp:Transcript_11889/g.28469  ORF Transcript_11889/g.28469 Transcript_11889/m.28469 type:complete len:102 (+) Transcript_11889:1980-2285(+)
MEIKEAPGSEILYENLDLTEPPPSSVISALEIRTETLSPTMAGLMLEVASSPPPPQSTPRPTPSPMASTATTATAMITTLFTMIDIYSMKMSCHNQHYVLQ